MLITNGTRRHAPIDFSITHGRRPIHGFHVER